MPAAGDAILIPSGPARHLFIVLNDPMPILGYGARDHCVLVNISSIRSHVPHDPTCVLMPDVHPFIQQPSYVYYQDVRVEPAQHIDACLASGYFILRPPAVDLAFVEAIKAGFQTSRKIKRVFKNLFP